MCWLQIEHLTHIILDDGYGNPLGDPLSSYGKGGSGGGQSRGGRRLRPRIPRQSGPGASLAQSQAPLFL